MCSRGQTTAFAWVGKKAPLRESRNTPFVFSSPQLKPPTDAGLVDSFISVPRALWTNTEIAKHQVGVHSWPVCRTRAVLNSGVTPDRRRPHAFCTGSMLGRRGGRFATGRGRRRLLCRGSHRWILMSSRCKPSVARRLPGLIPRRIAMEPTKAASMTSYRPPTGGGHAAGGELKGSRLTLTFNL